MSSSLPFFASKPSPLVPNCRDSLSRMLCIIVLISRKISSDSMVLCAFLTTDGDVERFFLMGFAGVEAYVRNLESLLPNLKEITTFKKINLQA